MLVIKSDIERARRELKREQRNQIPYAASLALNDVAFTVRHFVVNSMWPNAFPRARNTRLPGAMFRVDRSTKRRLRASVYDRLNREFIDHHITGDPKRAFEGKHLAVPISVNRLQSGRIGARSRPEALANSFKADLHGKGPAIWQRMRGGRLRLAYVLKTTTPVPARFPFYRVGRQRGEAAWPVAFARGIARALATAR